MMSRMRKLHRATSITVGNNSPSEQRLQTPLPLSCTHLFIFLPAKIRISVYNLMVKEFITFVQTDCCFQTVIEVAWCNLRILDIIGIFRIWGFVKNQENREFVHIWHNREKDCVVDILPQNGASFQSFWSVTQKTIEIWKKHDIQQYIALIWPERIGSYFGSLDKSSGSWHWQSCKLKSRAWGCAACC